ncbi:hypothetical protein AB2Q58_04180 [Listeria monocytogenes]|uniref:hypothetical protein n=1 Tax=Listeria monocytogenes TaxID=1639 RepID=UPI0016492A58|nr:hypothetical protein [Listeria monocytogenes]EKM3237854.1 hypothetical protein [Listeria monocytogenes]MBC3551273.1 hypothetical protein [Listeria monocytogenes]HEL8576365.1 hypothetical protein [Listeria monocytogenes]
MTLSCSIKKLCLIKLSSYSERARFNRLVIVPVNWSENEIRDYVNKSVNASEIEVILYTCEEVYILDESIEEIHTNDANRLEYFWNDAKEYVVEISQQNKTINFVVIAGLNTDEEDISKLFYEKYKNEKIIVNHVFDCWIKKENSVASFAGG